VDVGWVVKSLESRSLQEEGPFEVYKNCKAHRDGAPASARHAALSWMTTTSSVKGFFWQLFLVLYSRPRD
jgi:hypothetical protein